MRKWREDFLSFCNHKVYMIMLALTGVMGYGFLITHQTIGIDDTPYTYYFEEGLNVIVGRWFMYLLNKVFHVADFSPFVTDLAGVLIFMVAVTVWCTLLYSICGDRVPKWGYLFFSCIFLSCPLVAEVYTYYLHNGISVGYLCTGISLCFFRELVDGVANRKQVLVSASGTAVFLFVALGCYESFMIVWLLGVFLVLLTMRYMGIGCKVFLPFAAGAVAAVLALVLRSVMIAGTTAVFDLGYMKEEAVQRSVTEMVGWLFEPGALGEFAMAVKRIYVMYFAFAYAYYPIRVFVWASIFMVIFSVYRAIRQKDAWIAALTVGSFAAAFLLVIVEGKATLYRSAQFLPVVCGYGAFLFAHAVGGLKGRKITLPWKRKDGANGACGYKVCSKVACVVLAAILWNQCADLNHWFYIDWMKYESAKAMVQQIAVELERNYDTSKPVVFTGTYQTPKSIIEDAYVDYNSETFRKMKNLTSLLDEHLLEKFYRGEYGVWVAQTPSLSVLDWGINAFGTDEELVKFFAMHGYEIIANTDAARFEEAQAKTVDYPHFPEEGSIVDMGDYIVVHF